MDVFCGLIFFLIVAHSGFAICINISGSDLVYPDICYNITCSFGEELGFRSITYVITSNTNSPQSYVIIYQSDPWVCAFNNVAACQNTQNCSCDPDGLSTHLCYYHTLGGNGKLSFKCISGGQSTSMTATIAGKPAYVNVNGQSSDLIFPVTENDDLGPLICNATCVPSCTFWWTGPVNSSSNVLSIQQIKTSDNGTYICVSVNELGTARIYIDIVVNFGPKQLTLTPNSSRYEIMENASVEDITCSASCQPICDIFWLGPVGLSVLTNPLSLENIKRQEEGFYRCNASNHVSSMVSSNVTIIVNYGPGSSIVFNPVHTMITQKEGDKLQNITCSALCYPDCQYKWTKANVTVTNSSVLSKQKLTREDHGLYECKVWNKVDVKGGTKILNITVEFGPTKVNLSSNLTEHKVQENSSLPDITCLASCRPTCKITWTGPGGLFVSNNVLQLQHVNRNQTGIYKCNASNVVSSISSSNVNVIVTYGAGNSVEFNVPSTNITKLPGDNLQDIICSASCNPSCHYQWTKNGSTLEKGAALSLKRITKDKHGIYICKAWNEVDLIGTDKSLNVIVNYAPEFVSMIPNESSYTIKEGQNFSNIICSAMCRPDCHIFWEGEQGQASTSNILYIKSIKRSDAGTYRCNASNFIGSHLSALVNIYVTYSAEIITLDIEGNNFTIPEITTKYLNCSIDGFPIPATRWHINGHNIPEKENTTVFNMAPSCKDTGNYTCLAFNTEGNASRTKELFIICSPRSEYELPKKVAVGNDSILDINVSLLSYPKPDISWRFSKNASFFDEVPFNSSIGINRHLTSIYITNMKTWQYGFYQISVQNGIPDDFYHVFEVISQRQPDTPTNLNATCTTSFDSADIEWRCEFDGGDNQQFELYYAVNSRSLTFIKYASDLPDKGYRQYSFSKIDGLSPATSYIFKLVAFNSFGHSGPITASCNTTSKESENSSYNGVVTGVASGIGAACLVLVILISSIYVMRRYKYKGKKNNGRTALAHDQDDMDDEGLKDNILYESAGSDILQGTNSVEYATVDTTKKENKGKANQGFQETTLYSVVQKDSGTGKKDNDHESGRNKKDEKGKIKKMTVLKSKASTDDVYVNMSRTDDGETVKETRQNLNKDGLQYAELIFNPSKTGPKFVIHGLENRTIYADVDTTQKIDPLPDSDDDDEKKSMENNGSDKKSMSE